MKSRRRGSHLSDRGSRGALLPNWKGLCIQPTGDRVPSNNLGVLWLPGVQPLWKTAWPFVTKSHILLPCHPPIMFLGIYPSELKTCPYKSHMHISNGFLPKAKMQSNQDACARCMNNCNCYTSRQWEIGQCSKEMSSQARKRHGGVVRAYH